MFGIFDGVLAVGDVVSCRYVEIVESEFLVDV